jgi:hypothetical protein
MNRRTLIERLALGAGGVILNPIARTLVSEARGETQTRKIIVFILHGNGINPNYVFTPAEFQKATKDPYAPDISDPVMNGPKDYAWPAMLAALAPLRRKMLLVDGLALEAPENQHSYGFTALSNVKTSSGTGEYGGPPGAITIDQHIANRIGKDSAFKSVLVGIAKNTKTQEAKVFAAGRNQPAAHIVDPALLFKRLFGDVAPNGGANLGGTKHKVLMDSLRGDANRLRSSLAGPERVKLDAYLAAIDEYDARRARAAALSCQPPGAAAPNIDDNKTTPEDLLEFLTDTALVALKCGLTNVVGLSSCTGFSHACEVPFVRIAKGTPFESLGRVDGYGHGPSDKVAPAMNLRLNFHAALMKRMADSLATVKVGDKTLFDSSVTLLMSDNADAHHSTGKRWPLALLGDAGGALKADGRFIRYPGKGQGGWRSLADLYCTLATAVGVPTDDFGKAGGVEPVKGPLPEILA